VGALCAEGPTALCAAQCSQEVKDTQASERLWTCLYVVSVLST